MHRNLCHSKLPDEAQSAVWTGLGGVGPEPREREREREREDTAALKTGSGRAGQGWAFASNVGRLWAKREAGTGTGAH